MTTSVLLTVQSWDHDTAEGNTPLHEAARAGDLRMAERLLATGSAVDARNAGGATPLYWAAWHNQKKVAELLLAKGSDVNAEAQNGYTPLHKACQAGHLALAELLVGKGADVNATAKFGELPLHDAATYGHALVARFLLQRGANVNGGGANGWKPLHDAASYGHTEVVTVLLQHGAEVNSTDRIGSTPLHWAAYHGHADAAEVLLRNGASLRLRNQDGRTALDSALKQNHIECARRMKRTSLWWSANEGDLEAVRDLLSRGADPNESYYSNGDPTLVLAMQRGSFEMADLLLKSGAKASNDKRSLHLAARAGRHDLAQAMIAAGALPDARAICAAAMGDASEAELEATLRLFVDKGARWDSGADLWEVWPQAAGKWGKPVVQLLLQAGAPVNIGGFDKWQRAKNSTPLHEAAKHGRRDVVELLLDCGAEVTALNGALLSASCLAKRSGHKDVESLLKSREPWWFRLREYLGLYRLVSG